MTMLCHQPCFAAVLVSIHIFVICYECHVASLSRLGLDQYQYDLHFVALG